MHVRQDDLAYDTLLEPCHVDRLELAELQIGSHLAPVSTKDDVMREVIQNIKLEQVSLGFHISWLEYIEKGL